MTALEFFASARDAALQIKSLEERAQIMRERVGVQGHGYDAHGKSGVLDPMRKVDDLVDWEATFDEQVAECNKVIAEGWEIVGGIDALGGHEMAQVLGRHYLMAEDVAEIAKQRHCTMEIVVAAISAGLDMVDKIGIARLKDEGRAHV